MRDEKELIDSGIQQSLVDIFTTETQVQQEIIRGYNGQNGAKGHRAIAKSKVNPSYKSQNLKQQSGFNAEINMVTEQNIKAIREKSNIHAYRTDELGQVNNPKTDIVLINKTTGERIPSSNIQVKFRGKTGVENIKQLLGLKEFEKYSDHWLAIPTEQLYEAHHYIDLKIQKLNQQIEKQKKIGDSNKVNHLIKKRSEAESVKSRLIDGGSAEEAMKYRLRPLQQHMNKRVYEAHKAGKQATMQGVAISSILTMPFIAKRLITDDTYLWKDAGGDYAKIVASSALSTYVVTGTTVLIQGQLSASTSKLANQISNTNAIGKVLTASVDLSKNIRQLAKDPNYHVIDFVTDTSEHVTGTLSAAFLTTAVKQVLPTNINPIAFTIPGMIGYAAGQYIVKELIRLRKDAELAMEKRKEIEAFCFEMNQQLDEIYQELIQVCEKNASKWDAIHDLMTDIREAITPIQMNESISQLAERLKIELRLTNFQEFDEMMSDSNIPFTL